MAPKMPVGSYLEFARDERSGVLAEHGVGKRWKNLTVELKYKYDQKVRENKKRFGIAMEDLSE